MFPTIDPDKTTAFQDQVTNNWPGGKYAAPHANEGPFHVLLITNVDTREASQVAVAAIDCYPTIDLLHDTGHDEIEIATFSVLPELAAGIVANNADGRSLTVDGDYMHQFASWPTEAEFRSFVCTLLTGNPTDPSAKGNYAERCTTLSGAPMTPWPLIEDAIDALGGYAGLRQYLSGFDDADRYERLPELLTAATATTT